MGTLYGLAYSGWTEKARWALDHHGVAYTYVEHVPMLGEPALRIAARRPFARATVPLYVDDSGVYDDSLAIARHAERVGRGAPLFPAGSDAAIARWNATSEAMLAAERARLVRRLIVSDAALRESLPGWVPGFAAAAMVPTARLATQFLARKHSLANQGDDARARDVVRNGLVKLREALAGGAWLLGAGALSYADVLMAASLQGVRPVDDRFVPLGPASRACWTDDALADEFADVVAWRDALYAEHRRG